MADKESDPKRLKQTSIMSFVHAKRSPESARKGDAAAAAADASDAASAHTRSHTEHSKPHVTEHGKPHVKHEATLVYTEDGAGAAGSAVDGLDPGPPSDGKALHPRTAARLSSLSDAVDTSHEKLEQPVSIPDEFCVKHLRHDAHAQQPVPPLASTKEHTVLFQPYDPGHHATKPPRALRPVVDLWDGDHVRMPCSSQSRYEDKSGGETTLRSRWNLIRRSLSTEMKNSHQLQDAIMQYNGSYARQWNFRGLHAFFSKTASSEEKTRFFTKTLPKMVELALLLPVICPSVPLLKVNDTLTTVSLSQQQIASLLCNAFFCTFPRRNSGSREAEFRNYPSINFNRLFASGNDECNPVLAAKLRCLFHYFARVTERMPCGSLTFQRQAIMEPVEWKTSKSAVPKVKVFADGTIEDHGIGMLQVDFANKRIGGGVLGFGAVQEEIRFMICPELIVSRLFVETIEDHESVIITGAEQFSKYSGYSSTFAWEGDFVDKTPFDEWGRRKTQIVAIDALVFSGNYAAQLNPATIDRELHKAYVGFVCPLAAHSRGHLNPVATGNWGCGAFGGDKLLKALIQIIACTVAKRPLVYFTFGDVELCNDISRVNQTTTENEIKIGELYSILRSYHKAYRENKDYALVDFVCEKMQSNDDLDDETPPDSPASYNSQEGKGDGPIAFDDSEMAFLLAGGALSDD
eukprot:m.145920 g.145920  ORF g.145920 m.145920 type:complete len:690 (-) comp16795_c0_seq3:1113-3182(-)